MEHIDHEDFEEILSDIKDKLGDSIKFEEIRSIESNFDTKGMMFKGRGSKTTDGTVIAGEDNGMIAVDVSKADGEVISFILTGLDDREGMNNIIGWFNYNYE